MQWQFGRCARPVENYLSDFDSLARRFLSALEYEVFARHLLGEMPWRSAMAGLPVNKGEFWHAVYRIETALGAACVEYGLYPLWQYLDLRLPVGEDPSLPLPERRETKKLKPKKPEPNEQPGKQAVQQALENFVMRQRERENRRRAAAARARLKAA